MTWHRNTARSTEDMKVTLSPGESAIVFPDSDGPEDLCMLTVCVVALEQLDEEQRSRAARWLASWGKA